MEKVKKPYQAPKIDKVHLEMKNAVLGICHTSPYQQHLRP